MFKPPSCVVDRLFEATVVSPDNCVDVIFAVVNACTEAVTRPPICVAVSACACVVVRLVSCAVEKLLSAAVVRPATWVEVNPDNCVVVLNA